MEIVKDRKKEKEKECLESGLADENSD